MRCTVTVLLRCKSVFYKHLDYILVRSDHYLLAFIAVVRKTHFYCGCGKGERLLWHGFWPWQNRWGFCLLFFLFLSFLCFFCFFNSVIVATAKSVEWIHCHIGGATRFVRWTDATAEHFVWLCWVRAGTECKRAYGWCVCVYTCHFILSLLCARARVCVWEWEREREMGSEGWRDCHVLHIVVLYVGDKKHRWLQYMEKWTDKNFRTPVRRWCVFSCSDVCVYVFVTMERVSASRTMTGVPGTERARFLPCM